MNIINANALAIPLPSNSVQCCVTSPPYWGLRDYGVGGQLGLEKSPTEYVASMVAVFREVYRILRDDGVLWLNLGSSYATSEMCSRKCYNIREDLTEEEINYVCLEMFGMRIDGYQAASQRLMPQMLSHKIHRKAKTTRPRISSKRIEAELSETQGTEGQGTKSKTPSIQTRGNSKTWRKMCLLRRNNIRISNDRACKRRWCRTSEKNYRTPPAFEREDTSGYSQSRLSAGKISSSLLQLQLRERLLGVLSTSEIKEELIPPYLTKYFRPVSYKPKDLINIPFLVAEALRADGWYLRSDCIWAKPNPMPESVTDRPTKSHEYIFLMTKSARYFWDQEAVKEDMSTEFTERYQREKAKGMQVDLSTKMDLSRHDTHGKLTSQVGARDFAESGKRNLRTVWTIATQPTSEAHFATFPEALAERCIKAGTSAQGCCPKCGKPWERVTERPKPPKEVYTRNGKPLAIAAVSHPEIGIAAMGQKLQDWYNEHPVQTLGFRPACTCPAADPIPCTVFDPFTGSGTTGRVAIKLARRFVGTELKFDYIHEIARKRTSNLQPIMFEAANA